MLKIQFTAILLFSAICIQLSFSAVVEPNRGDNANNDNDETPTTPPAPEPPIQHQFAVVSSKLTAVENQKLKTKATTESAENPKEEVGEINGEDTDDSEGGEFEAESGGDEGFGGEARRHGRVGKKRVKQSEQFRGAVPCGYYRLKSGQAISIQSTNYNSGGTLRNFELCTWRVFGQQCKVKTSCPCFDLPSSADCKSDLLKVTDMYSFAHKFCGDIKPQGIYNSTTNNLKVHFRSDATRSSDIGQGFRCYVGCTAYGGTDPVQLSYTPQQAMCVTPPTP